MRYQNIREYLEKTKMTEREFAEKIGVSQPFVNLLKRGERRPTPEIAEKIEALTGISFRKLLLNNNAAT